MSERYTIELGGAGQAMWREVLSHAPELMPVLLLNDRFDPPGPRALYVGRFHSYDTNKPDGFIGFDPVYLYLPTTLYDYIIVPCMEEPNIPERQQKRIVYTPDKIFVGSNALHALLDQEGPHMDHMRVYPLLLEPTVFGFITDCRQEIDMAIELNAYERRGTF